MVNDLADELEAAFPDGAVVGARIDAATFARILEALRRPVPADVADFIREAGNQFRLYAVSHAAKGTAEADEKASRNNAWADRAFALLNTLASGRDEWFPLCQDYAENELKECLDAMPLPRDDKLLIAEMRKRGLWVYRRPTPPQGDQQ